MDISSFLPKENELPLDNLIEGGGLTKIFRKIFFMGGHMNASGYILTAKMVMSYIDYIIRHNHDDFVQVPFLDKPFYHINYKR